MAERSRVRSKLHFMSPDAHDEFLLPDLSHEVHLIDHDPVMTAAEKLEARNKFDREYAAKSERLNIVHQTGTKELDDVRAAYRSSAFTDARVVPYLDPIVDEIAAADLVVSRAGAMTIGELAAAGRAAILVPFAAATNNHQELNARVVERAGGAIVLTESQLSPQRLGLAIAEIISHPDRAARMGAAAKTLAAPDATKKIVDLLEKIVRSE